jgi:hypothetical protein
MDKYGMPLDPSKSTLLPVVPSSPEITVRTMQSDLEELLTMPAGRTGAPSAEGQGGGEQFPVTAAPVEVVQKKSKKWLAVVVAALFLIVAGAVAYFFFLR